jgi:3-oxoadipate enol-lactonase
MATVARDGAEIWWDSEGTGEPILLIQGLGYHSDMWFRLLPHLSTSYRCIRFDNRGVGRTGVPEGPYTVETMAADALAVLDAAGEESAHVFGCSMGGLIAQEVALMAPKRVRTLTLGCTHPGGPDIFAPSDAALTMLRERASVPAEEAAKMSIPFVYASGTPQERIEEDLAKRAELPTTPEGYTNQLLGASQWRGAHDRLEQLTMPTLVIHGNDDELVPAGNAKLIADRIAGAELVLLDGASHIFFTDQEEATAAALLDFLGRHRRG